MSHDEKGQRIQTLEKIVRILIEECWNDLSEIAKKRITELTGIKEANKMTEEIMIDGVNVAGCEYYNGVVGDVCGYCNIGEGYLYTCDSDENCYYKQLKRLEQENEQLKKQNEILLGQLVINDGEYVTVQISQSQFEEYNELKEENEENEELKETQKGLIKRITYFENVIQKTFNCLIKANAKGKITDTLWVTNIETLWDMLANALKIENIDEYENEVLKWQ